MKHEPVTKLEAARRQMNQAVHLFFERRDSVSVHTLASAAAQILSDLCAAKGLFSPIRGAGIIREDRRREWLAALKKAENFFKHADRDADASLEFNADITEGTLFDSTYMYLALTGKRTYESAIFESWLFQKHPEFLNESQYKEALRELVRRTGVSAGDWDFFLDLIRKKDHLPTDISSMFG